MGIGATAKTKLFIADPGTPTISDYVEVKNVANLGDIMRQFASITVEEVGAGTSYALKGLENFPNFSVTLNRNNDDPGQQDMQIASAAREVLYNFRLEEPDGGVPLSEAVTVTIASPGLFTAVAHGLDVGDRVEFGTTGALPTGLVAGTTYFVKTAPSVDTFTVAATADGTAIVTTGSQSGTHTVTSQPLGTTTDWKGEVFGFGTIYGGPNNLRQVKTEISIRPETFVYRKTGT
jgi:hypothetical protein